MSHCSIQDQPVKARGRQISEARARGAIKANGDLRWKRDFLTTESTLCGFRTHEADAEDGIQTMLDDIEMSERVIKSLDFLRRQCDAESIT